MCRKQRGLPLDILTPEFKLRMTMTFEIDINGFAHENVVMGSVMTMTSV